MYFICEGEVRTEDGRVWEAEVRRGKVGELQVRFRTEGGREGTQRDCRGRFARRRGVHGG